MTDTRSQVPAGPNTAGGNPTAANTHGWVIVAALAATQTVGYGVLY